MRSSLWRISSRERPPTRDDGSRSQARRDWRVVRLLRQNGVQAGALVSREQGVNLGNDLQVGRVHRLGRHPFDHTDAGDNDFLGAQFRNQPIKQNAAIVQADRLGHEPAGDFGAVGLGQIAKAVPAFD